MGSSKQKYCKCGHNKDSHKDKASKFSLSNQCNKCACSSFMNRNHPTKSDYAITVIFIGLALFFIGLSYFLIADSNPALTGTENEPVVFTVGQLYGILVLVAYLVDIYIVFVLIIDPVFDIIYYKKRRKFSIDEDG